MENVGDDIDLLKTQMTSQKNMIERLQSKGKPLDYDTVFVMFEQNLELVDKIKKNFTNVKSSHRSCESYNHFYGSSFQPHFTSTPTLSLASTISTQKIVPSCASSSHSICDEEKSGLTELKDGSSYADLDKSFGNDNKAYEKEQTVFDAEDVMDISCQGGELTELLNDTEDEEEEEDGDDEEDGDGTLLEMEQDDDVAEEEGLIFIPHSDLINKEPIAASSSSSSSSTEKGQSFVMFVDMKEGEKRRLKSKKKRKSYNRKDYQVSKPKLVPLDESNPLHQEIVKTGNTLIGSCVVFDRRSHIMINCCCGTNSKENCVNNSRCACFSPNLADFYHGASASSTMTGEISEHLIYVDDKVPLQKAKGMARLAMKVLYPERFIGKMVSLGPLPPAWREFAYEFAALCLAYLDAAEKFPAVQIGIGLQMKQIEAKAMAAPKSERDEIRSRVTKFGPDGNQQTMTVHAGRMKGTGRTQPNKRDKLDLTKVTIKTVKRPFSETIRPERQKDANGRIRCSRCQIKGVPNSINRHEKECQGGVDRSSEVLDRKRLDKDANGRIRCSRCQIKGILKSINRHEKECQGGVDRSSEVLDRNIREKAENGLVRCVYCQIKGKSKSMGTHERTCQGGVDRSNEELGKRKMREKAGNGLVRCAMCRIKGKSKSMGTHEKNCQGGVDRSNEELGKKRRKLNADQQDQVSVEDPQ